MKLVYGVSLAWVRLVTRFSESKCSRREVKGLLQLPPRSNQSVMTRVTGRWEHWCRDCRCDRPIFGATPFQPCSSCPTPGAHWVVALISRCRGYLSMIFLFGLLCRHPHVDLD